MRARVNPSLRATAALSATTPLSDGGVQVVGKREHARDVGGPVHGVGAWGRWLAREANALLALAEERAAEHSAVNRGWSSHAATSDEAATSSAASGSLAKSMR